MRSCCMKIIAKQETHLPVDEWFTALEGHVLKDYKWSVGEVEQQLWRRLEDQASQEAKSEV